MTKIMICLCEEFRKYMNVVHESKDIGCMRYCEPSQDELEKCITNIRIPHRY